MSEKWIPHSAMALRVEPHGRERGRGRGAGGDLHAAKQRSGGRISPGCGYIGQCRRWGRRRGLPLMCCAVHCRKPWGWAPTAIHDVQKSYGLLCCSCH